MSIVYSDCPSRQGDLPRSLSHCCVIKGRDDNCSVYRKICKLIFIASGGPNSISFLLLHTTGFTNTHLFIRKRPGMKSVEIGRIFILRCIGLDGILLSNFDPALFNVIYWSIRVTEVIIVNNFNCFLVKPASVISLVKSIILAQFHHFPFFFDINVALTKHQSQMRSLRICLGRL